MSETEAFIGSPHDSGDTMSINRIDGDRPNAPVCGAGDSLPSPAAVDQALDGVQAVHADLDFSTFQRVRYREELVACLDTGWLPGDSLPPEGGRQSGPVVMLREAARSPDGVVFGECNLALDPASIVLGKRHSHGGADSFFVQLEGAFHVLCIESGQDTSRYEIYVSPARDWATFLSHLEQS
ncbi:hypothetical protein EGJ34_04875 [Stenotrophomonas sp. 278]|nr:hypothetical protein EGJ34_04875 [Stenotrophomonas sp. 278]